MNLHALQDALSRANDQVELAVQRILKGEISTATHQTSPSTSELRPLNESNTTKAKNKKNKKPLTTMDKDGSPGLSAEERLAEMERYGLVPDIAGLPQSSSSAKPKAVVLRKPVEVWITPLIIAALNP